MRVAAMLSTAYQAPWMGHGCHETPCMSGFESMTLQDRTSDFPQRSKVCQHSLVKPYQETQHMPAPQEVVRPLQLDERMIALAAAISIDFDYFSQHSHGPGSVSHPKRHLMQRVVFSFHTKSSGALGQQNPVHPGAAACEVEACKRATAACQLQHARISSDQKLQSVAYRDDARLPVSHANPSARVPSARGGGHPNWRS